MASSDSRKSGERTGMILVVGATGTLGGTITRMLLAEDKPVRILARPHSKYQPLAEAGAQAIMGDLKNRASLDLACRDINTVITTANSALRGGDDNIQTVDLQGNRSLIDAAKAAGVRHFIYVSGNGADANHPEPMLNAKGKTEEYLIKSGMQYTIIAPNPFMDVWIPMVIGGPITAGRPITLVGGNRKHSMIASLDVAKFIVAFVNNPRAINQRLIVGGPQAISFRDAVVVCERTLNRKMPVQTAAPMQPIPGFPDNLLGLLASLDTFDSPIEMTELNKAFGIKLVSMEQFVAEMLKGCKT
jgi:uncharacterized protein YbjT (DUF2867 family)